MKKIFKKTFIIIGGIITISSILGISTSFIPLSLENRQSIFVQDSDNEIDISTVVEIKNTVFNSDPIPTTVLQRVTAISGQENNFYINEIDAVVNTNDKKIVIKPKQLSKHYVLASQYEVSYTLTDKVVFVFDNANKALSETIENYDDPAQRTREAISLFLEENASKDIHANQINFTSEINDKNFSIDLKMSSKENSSYYSPFTNEEYKVKYRPKLNDLFESAGKDSLDFPNDWDKDQPTFDTLKSTMLQIVFNQNPKLGSLEDFRNNVDITADFTGGIKPTTVTIKPKDNGIYLYGTGTPYEVICTPMTQGAYVAIPIDWITKSGTTITGLDDSKVQTVNTYNTLDLTGFNDCIAIGDNAFSAANSTKKNFLFGSSYSVENPTRDPALEGPIKYLKLPDSITSIGANAFRRSYSFNSTLILPKGITTLGDGYPFHFSGFTGVSFNKNYADYKMDKYKPFWMPFLRSIELDKDNTFLTLVNHYDEFKNIDGQICFPKIFKGGASNKGKMGWGQKPILCWGVVDFREIMDYSKDYEGNDTGRDPGPTYFHDLYSGDGFLDTCNCSTAILPETFNTWEANSFRNPCQIKNIYITNPTKISVGSFASAMNGATTREMKLYVPQALLSSYEEDSGWTTIKKTFTKLTFEGYTHLPGES